MSRDSSTNSSRPRREHIDDVLEGARMVINLSKDALGLAPIPGLAAAADALSELIGKVLKTKANKKAQKELSEEIKLLSETMIHISKKSAAAIDESQPVHRDEARTRVNTSSELKGRVDALIKTLEDVTEEINELSKHNAVVRFLKSNQDEQALKGFTDRIRNARVNFMLESMSTVESILTALVQAIDRIDLNATCKEDEDTLRALPIAEASYQSMYTQSKTHYLAGTRVDILDELEKWARADAEFAKVSVYILSGIAGSGKSTIACEVAKRLDKAKILGASFFFVRGIERLSTTHFILPTIAFQLANKIQELRRPIVDAARAYVRSNETKQLEHQLDALLKEPLKSLPPDHRPLVIIIDAVDECTQSSQDEVARLLFLLMRSIHRQSLPLRILLTTRPEIHIERPLTSIEFRDITKPFKLHDVPLDTVNMDITRYVEAGLSCSPFKAELEAEHPSIIAELTQRARGLFIYASVACNFIFEPLQLEDADDAVRRLNQWLSATSTAVPAMTEPLDMLYLSVLNQGFPRPILERPNYLKSIQDVLASVSLLQDQVSPKTLEALIGTPVKITMDIVSRLASVLLPCKDTDVEIQPVHASFPQFLMDSTRCVDSHFFVDLVTYHTEFASKCLALLIKPGVLQMKQQVPIPAHVAYACLHWPTHIVSSQASSALLTLLQGFLKRDLLLWFSTLSVMKRLSSAAPALSYVQQWVQSITELDVDNQIPSLLNDGYRFILEYVAAIERDPMQIYISALPMMPTCLLQELYAPNYQHMSALQLLSKRDSGWGACLCIMEGHIEQVISVKYSPDGHIIISSSHDSTVHTWQADSGTPLNIMRGHKASVWAADFCPDPDRPAEIVSVSDDHTLCIWDFASGAPLHSIPIDEESCCVAYSPDGKKIVAGSDINGFKIWDAITREQLVQADDAFHAYSISFSPTSNLIVTTWYNMVQILDAHTGGLICSLQGHAQEINCAAFFPDERRVASGGSDNTITIWDVETRSCLRQLIGHTDWIYAIAISPKGGLITSGSNDCTICLWDAESGELLNILKGHTNVVRSLCFSPNGHTFVSASDDRTLRIWDVVRHSSGMTKAEEHLSEITCVEFSSDGTIIATGSKDGSVSIWETQTGKQLHHILLECQNYVDSLTILPDNQTLAYATYDENVIHIWDVSAGKIHKKPVMDIVKYVTSSSDGQWIASAGFCTVYIWHVSDGKLEQTIGHDYSGNLKYFGFSSDNKMLQHLPFHGKQYIWEVSTGALLDTEAFSWEPSSSSDVQFREENGWIVSNNSKKLAWIAGSKRGHKFYYMRATFRFHGKYYAVGSNTGQLTIIDLSKLED
ncbi:hypothetical protein QCA50_008840 [Cerrena zonata]|uniref:NACHT domain-containing protein n=1 Tax=Cerrena zonata TaxID=2478898 RepID=A0AAW0G440_9APHY